MTSEDLAAALERLVLQAKAAGLSDDDIETELQITIDTLRDETDDETLDE